jgi:hypothetical protein
MELMYNIYCLSFSVGKKIIEKVEETVEVGSPQNDPKYYALTHYLQSPSFLPINGRARGNY